MSEKVNGKTIFSLFEVTKSIQQTLNDRYTSSFWVSAEMNKLNYYKQSGHCYPELVEKVQGKVVAQVKSNIWKDDFVHINNKFLKVLKEPLKDGIKILFLANITFDSCHGLALRIIDVDPAYTLGDLEREKQETINRLRDEGIFTKNKLLKLPLLPQRIAIISVETSKGYADFTKVIETNSWGYRFFHLLFPSLLQGEKAIAAIVNELHRIKKISHHFDVVAIIRGGGGDIGLSCYNSYLLAKEIALFPLPVITGIGHATNETVAEMISFSNAITPTKLAEYLLQQFHNFSVPVQQAEEKIIEKSNRLLSEENKKFLAEVKLFRSVTENMLFKNRNDVEREKQTLFQESRFRFKSEKERLSVLTDGISKELRVQVNAIKSTLQQVSQQLARAASVLMTSEQGQLGYIKEKLFDKYFILMKDETGKLNNLEKNVMNMNPANVLKRGFSITRLNGKTVKNTEDVKEGDMLDTILYVGSVSSIVKSFKNNEDS